MVKRVVSGKERRVRSWPAVRVGADPGVVGEADWARRCAQIGAAGSARPGDATGLSTLTPAPLGIPGPRSDGLRLAAPSPLTPRPTRPVVDEPGARPPPRPGRCRRSGRRRASPGARALLWPRCGRSAAGEWRCGPGTSGPGRDSLRVSGRGGGRAVPATGRGRDRSGPAPSSAGRRPVPESWPNSRIHHSPSRASWPVTTWGTATVCRGPMRRRSPLGSQAVARQVESWAIGSRSSSHCFS